MRWVKLRRYKIRVFGSRVRTPMKGMTAPEEHTHFLHSLLTNNVKALKQGTLNYNLWLRQNGQPVGDFFLYRIGDSFLLDTEKPASEVIEEFQRLKLSLRVYFEDLSHLDHVFLFGEGASEFVKETFGVVLEDYEVKEVGSVYLAKNPLRLREEGYDLIGDLSGFLKNLKREEEIGERELEDIRIGRCIPRIGKELREGFSPLEAGVLGYAIDMNKGCYVGQEAIARVHFRGRTPRVLVKLRGELSEDSTLYEGDRAVGLITSVSSDGRVGLGYVLRSVYERGKELRSQMGKVYLEESCEGQVQ